MKEIKINSIEEGQRLDKYLLRCLPNASKSFLYKMMRKKNITLNGKKADGSEKINTGDILRIFFSDETFDKFAAKGENQSNDSFGSSYYTKLQMKLKNDANAKLDVVYEDDDILLVNKPAGILSQKAEKDDISMVEYIICYLLDSKAITVEDLKTFRPGVCNRLDRNTSGIIAAGKTIKGLQKMTAAFKDRSLAKYYLCIVDGRISKRERIEGYLYKDEKSNKVTIYKDNEINIPEEALFIATEYMPVCHNDRASLVKVHLITGRSHQIRAHLSSIHHPIIGDYKYGDNKVNTIYKNKYKIQSQMLHAYELDMPQEALHVHTSIPDEFVRVLKGENLWEPGIPEALEGLH
jgi:23S rRNA pseudouridine955/2504/2580 synthase